jgi:hypothetical protein
MLRKRADTGRWAAGPPVEVFSGFSVDIVGRHVVANKQGCDSLHHRISRREKLMFRHAKNCLFIVIAVSVGLASSMPPTAEAQSAAAGPKYRVLDKQKVLTDPVQIKALRRMKNDALGSGAFSETEIKKWYEHFLRSFTFPSEVGNLPGKRKELRTDLEKSVKLPAFRQLLTKLTTTYMQGYARSAAFHPAVRFNAMLVIGDMNFVERSASQTKVPVPSPESLQFLLTEFRSKKQIDAVRVAALLGMLRHAQLQWGNTQMPLRGEIAKEMMQFLNAPPLNRNPNAHLWMQRRAIDVLASLGAIGRLPGAYQAIDDLVTDADADVRLRCTAAGALALLDAKSDQVNIADAALKLGTLAAEASRHDLAWIDEYKRRKAAESQDAPGSAGYAGLVSTSGVAVDQNDGAAMMGVEVEVAEMDETSGFDALTGGSDGSGDADPEVQVARRKILTKLHCIKKGLAGLEAAAALRPQDKSRVDAVNAQLKELLAAASPKEMPDLDGLAKGVKKAVRKMEQFTRRAATPNPVGATARGPSPRTGG